MGNEEYTDMFVSEAKEHLQNINNALLSLEKNPSDDDAITVIFRAAHTIKGNSATMGFDSIRDLTHKLEDTLDRFRKHELKITPDIVDTLFQCLDMIGGMIDDLKSDPKNTTDTTSMISALESIMDKDKNQNAEKKDQNAGKSSSSILLDDTDLKTIVKESKKSSCYTINVTLAKDCVFKAVRARLVTMNLESKSKIIKYIPSLDIIEKGEFSDTFTLILSSKEKSSDLESLASRVAEVDSVTVGQLPKDLKTLKRQFTSESKDPAATPSAQNQNDSQSISSRLPSSTPDSSKSVESVQSVRVSMDRLDKIMNLVGELLINKMRLEDIERSNSLKDLSEVLKTMDYLLLEIQDSIMEIRMVPVDHIFGRFPRLVRDLSRAEGKDISIDIEGSEIELDRTVLDRMGDPLVHIIRNSIDHGIETSDERKSHNKPTEGKIKLIARREKSHVSIEVTDDGRGLDKEKIIAKAIEKKIITEEFSRTMKDTDIYNLIFLPGFSTKEKITEISGRGVGLDVVKSNIDSLNGKLRVESDKVKGTKITMTLPLTVAIQQALLIRVSTETYAVPLNMISETISFRSGDIKVIQDREVIIYRNHELPLIRLARVFGLNSDDTRDEEIAIVVKRDDELIGFVIDSIIGEQQIIIKTMGDMLKNIKGFAGGTILGNGNVALILDINTIIEIS